MATSVGFIPSAGETADDLFLIGPIVSDDLPVAIARRMSDAWSGRLRLRSGQRRWFEVGRADGGAFTEDTQQMLLKALLTESAFCQVVACN